MRIFQKKKTLSRHISLDEVLLDGENRPGFNTSQLEGTFEVPVKARNVFAIGAVFILVILIFSIRLGNLQALHGAEYLKISENNRLNHIPVFAERGVILDRNGVEIAWNVAGKEDDPFSRRQYTTEPGFAHMLGYVSYPAKDNAGFWQKDRSEIVGRSGIELVMNRELAGTNGVQLVETNAQLDVLNANIIAPAEDGDNITLTIDHDIQTQLFQSMAKLMEESGYQGGAGVIMDVEGGDVIAMASLPEFNSQIMSDGTDKEHIQAYFESPQKPFLNRAISGLYTPGSIIKPFIALAALNEGVIDRNTTVFSDGQIEIRNPYNPDEVATFSDWKDGGHGKTNVIKAIGESVNTFFYSISGGYESQEGIGITKIDEYLEAFGFAEPTGFALGNEPRGVIPSPEWKEKTFNDIWRLGDTYITSIGQFGFQITPLSMARTLSALVNNGYLVQPRLTLDAKVDRDRVPIPVTTQHFDTVREGMRYTVTDGTAGALRVSYVNVAAKTGTAQVGAKNEFINSWVTGFFPYEDPQYVFVIVMERGPNGDTTRSASWAMRDLLDWIHENRPEYLSHQSFIDPAEQTP